MGQESNTRRWEKQNKNCMYTGALKQMEHTKLKE